MSNKLDQKQWLQVDLGKTTRVTMVGTQGRVEWNQFVTEFFVSMSQDGEAFENYKEGNVTKVWAAIIVWFTCE